MNRDFSQAQLKNKHQEYLKMKTSFYAMQLNPELTRPERENIMQEFDNQDAQFE